MTKQNLTKLIISIAQDDFTTEADKFEGIDYIDSCDINYFISELEKSIITHESKLE